MLRHILLLSLVVKISYCFLVVNLENRNKSFHNITGAVNYTRDVKISNKTNRPDYVDWRIKGKVSPVKNQGTCEACWAFAIVATVESHARIYLNKKTLLSEQFLIDCLPSSTGCYPMPIMASYADIIINIGGLVAASKYPPYEQKKGYCRWKGSVKGLSLTRPHNGPIKNQSAETGVFANPQTVLHDVRDRGPEPHNGPIRNLSAETGLFAHPQSVLQGDIGPKPDVMVVGFSRVKPDEEDMARIVAKYGPITAAINPASMAKYTGGIDEPTDEECDCQNLKHTVTIVGYNAYVGEDRTVPYWIIKNSWGDKWGDKGYYYLVRGRNACGIASDVSFPIIGQ